MGGRRRLALTGLGRMNMLAFRFGHALGFRKAVRRDGVGLNIGRRVERRDGAAAERRLDARLSRFRRRIGIHHRFAARSRPGRFDERALLLLIVPRETFSGLGRHGARHPATHLRALPRVVHNHAPDHHGTRADQTECQLVHACSISNSFIRAAMRPLHVSRGLPCKPLR
jgi:hypothetical protein